METRIWQYGNYMIVHNIRYTILVIGCDCEFFPTNGYKTFKM